MPDYAKLMDDLVASVQGYLRRSMEPVLQRLKVLEERRPERGETAEKGEPGPPGRDGVDGAKGEAGAPGEPGSPGTDGAPGQRGEQGLAGERGEKGDSGQSGERGEPGPRGEKGDKGDPGERGEAGIDGKQGLPGETGPAGDRGEKGDAGQDGRDALEVEILEGIGPAKRYQRGTYASHRGGIWKAVRPTEMLPEDGDPFTAGWTCVVRGLDEVAVEVGADMRTFALGLRMSDGKVVHKTFTTPVTIHRGIWRPEGFEVDGVFHAYRKGDQTARDGSQWTLMSDVESGAPGTEGSGWQLSVKRGQDGKHGLRGDKGERGAEGRAGRDLTQMGPDGSKW